MWLDEQFACRPREEARHQITLWPSATRPCDRPGRARALPTCNARRRRKGQDEHEDKSMVLFGLLAQSSGLIAAIGGVNNRCLPATISVRPVKLHNKVIMRRVEHGAGQSAHAPLLSLASPVRCQLTHFLKDTVWPRGPTRCGDMSD